MAMALLKYLSPSEEWMKRGREGGSKVRWGESERAGKWAGGGNRRSSFPALFRAAGFSEASTSPPREAFTGAEKSGAGGELEIRTLYGCQMKQV